MLSGSKWFFACCISLIIHASLGLSFYRDWKTPQLERSSGVSLIIAETQTSLLSGEINSRPETIQEEQLQRPKKTKSDDKKPVETLKPKIKAPETETKLNKHSVDQTLLKQEQPAPLYLPKAEIPPKVVKTEKHPKAEKELKKDIKKDLRPTKKKKKRAKTNPKKLIGSARNLKKRKTKSKPGNHGRVKNKISGKASLSNYKGRLRSRLLRNVRSSSKSGTVYISFTILKSGQIRGLRVYKSSGNNKLDKLALNTAKRSSPFPPLPRGHKSLKVTAPIRFR
jgi:protein TonB